MFGTTVGPIGIQYSEMQYTVLSATSHSISLIDVVVSPTPAQAEVLTQWKKVGE